MYSNNYARCDNGVQIIHFTKSVMNGSMKVVQIYGFMKVLLLQELLYWRRGDTWGLGGAWQVVWGLVAGLHCIIPVYSTIFLFQFGI